jgi:hypothetical protein
MSIYDMDTKKTKSKSSKHDSAAKGTVIWSKKTIVFVSDSGEKVLRNENLVAFKLLNWITFFKIISLLN